MHYYHYKFDYEPLQKLLNILQNKNILFCNKFNIYKNYISFFIKNMNQYQSNWKELCNINQTMKEKMQNYINFNINNDQSCLDSLIKLELSYYQHAIPLTIDVFINNTLKKNEIGNHLNKLISDLTKSMIKLYLHSDIMYLFESLATIKTCIDILVDQTTKETIVFNQTIIKNCKENFKAIEEIISHNISLNNINKLINIISEFNTMPKYICDEAKLLYIDLLINRIKSLLEKQSDIFKRQKLAHYFMSLYREIKLFGPRSIFFKETKNKLRNTILQYSIKLNGQDAKSYKQTHNSMNNSEINANQILSDIKVISRIISDKELLFVKTYDNKMTHELNKINREDYYKYIQLVISGLYKQANIFYNKKQFSYLEKAFNVFNEASSLLSKLCGQLNKPNISHDGMRKLKKLYQQHLKNKPNLIFNKVGQTKLSYSETIITKM